MPFSYYISSLSTMPSPPSPWQRCLSHQQPSRGPCINSDVHQFPFHLTRVLVLSRCWNDALASSLTLFLFHTLATLLCSCIFALRTIARVPDSFYPLSYSLTFFPRFFPLVISPRFFFHRVFSPLSSPIMSRSRCMGEEKARRATTMLICAGRTPIIKRDCCIFYDITHLIY